MARNVHDRYLEAEVLSADPMKLVWLLYRGAIEAVRAALRHLAGGSIRERSHEINRAWGMLQELSDSLDRASGGEISKRLAGLYAYMQMRLVESNIKQSGEPLEEVEALLSTLIEAWQQARSSGAPEEHESSEEYEMAAEVLG